jgi:hypothetical protein
VILHMLRIGATQRYHDPLASGINDLQELSKTHEAVSRAKTELLHRIQTHYLSLYFPEAERFRSSGRSDGFFAFLELFPTPASITALDKDSFIAAAWDVAGRKVAKAAVRDGRLAARDATPLGRSHGGRGAAGRVHARCRRFRLAGRWSCGP